ncbi:carbohydrate binding domain-containing protein [Zooshikella sp. RANM57]|uniref:carbohydrate binding domain-containing protein n=1 Tax=Zooshikella sp. RANM57 TaxID=3425863 RepID=UPI003D6F5442
MHSFNKALACSLIITTPLLSSTYVLAQQPVIMDVMAVYTKNTDSKYDMPAKLSQFINYANKSYENSNINIKLRLVHHSILPDTEGFNDKLTKPSLKKLKSSNYVAELRAKHGADFVTLVGPSSQYCGLGYLPWRNKKGELSANSTSVAYNWVGVNCVSAYAHELGHNMGLHHSRAQKSKGSIYEWGVGHGEVGQYVTNMAYQSAYSQGKWVPRLPFFSNPTIFECHGMACGVDIHKKDGTNAALALNRVALQLAEFMPTKYELANKNNTNVKLCNQPKIPGNLIDHPKLKESELQYWHSHSGSQLTIEKIQKSCGQDNALNVANTQGKAEVYTIIKDLKADIYYNFSANVKLSTPNNAREQIKFILQRPRQEDIILKTLSVTNKEFMQVKASFILSQSSSLKNEQKIKLAISSTSNRKGSAFLLDDIVVKKAINQPEKPTFKTHTLFSHNFEDGLNSWHQGFDSQIALTKSQEGQHHLAIANRPYWYAGAAYDVRGLLKNNTTYQVKANFKLTSQSNIPQYADMRLYYYDDAGHHWLTINQQPVSVNQWHTITGNINISPKGQVLVQKLFIFGPDKGINFAVDNVQLSKMSQL